MTVVIVKKWNFMIEKLVVNCLINNDRVYVLGKSSVREEKLELFEVRI